MAINITYRFPLSYPEKTKFVDQVEKFCSRWYSGANEFNFYTSGSTGSPKLIVISRDQMTASAEGTISFFKLQSKYTSLLCLDPERIAGAMMLVRSILADMQLIITPPVGNPMDLLEQTDQVDFSAFVPYQLDTIISTGDKGIEKLNWLKVIICGGAPVSPYLEEKIRQNLSCPVFQTYGMTETVSHVALRHLNGPGKTDLYTSLPGVELKQDERGCLLVKGAVTANQLIVTNDLVEFENDKFRWVGRADNTINSGGIKIQCEQIEDTALGILEAMGLNNKVVAAGVHDDRLGQKLVLFIEGTLKDPERFKTELHKQLPKFHYPKLILFREQFPPTESGKISRQALITSLADQHH